MLNAQKGLNDLFTLTLVTDSLNTTNYHYDSVYNYVNAGSFIVTLLASGQQSAFFFDGDYLDVNITSHNNGRISGTFSGKLTPLNGGLDYRSKSSVVITGGKLNNIPVIY